MALVNNISSGKPVNRPNNRNKAFISLFWKDKLSEIQQNLVEPVKQGGWREGSPQTPAKILLFIHQKNYRGRPSKTVCKTALPNLADGLSPARFN